MIEVFKNLYIGNDQTCSFNISSDWYVIHACKHPCHRRTLGYNNSLHSTHPNCLIFEKNNHLVLNMVDMEQEFLARFTNPIIFSALKFIEKNIENGKVLIHCNQGVSRSPSIALVYLAKKGEIQNGNYIEAKSDFLKLYPKYSPGKGISAYLNKNWSFLT